MGKHDKPAIELLRNGPIKVKGLEKFKNSRGADIETRPVMFLCRCGESNRKPFCDGTHDRSGFSDKKHPDRVPDKVDDYAGRDITIHDNRGVCSHRGHCTDNLPKVYRTKHRPWIRPDAADAEDNIRVIEMCPSGALSYTKEGRLHKDLDREPSIRIDRNGPYDVQGGPEFIDPDGNVPESREHYTLCRCGQSKNKPFCNGEHWKEDFQDQDN